MNYLQHIFRHLPEGKFKTIIADPPWAFQDSATRGAAEDHYRTLPSQVIALMPVEDLAAKNAALALWCPDTHLPDALAVAQAWGFDYKHLLVWAKGRIVCRPGNVGDCHPVITQHVGLGHYARKAHEVALLCTRGRPRILDHGVPSWFLHPREAHSAKPPNLHWAMERMFEGPRLELFARQQRDGWTVWGNEMGMSP